jgi:hypothetical protein
MDDAAAAMPAMTRFGAMTNIDSGRISEDCVGEDCVGSVDDERIGEARASSA